MAARPRARRAARGSSRRSRSGRSRACCSSQAVSGCAFSSVTPPCVAQRVWPSPVVEAEPFGPAASFRNCEVARRRGRTRGRPPRAARSRPSRSPGTRAAADPADQQRLRRPATDVSDDPAHLRAPFPGNDRNCPRKPPWKRKSPAAGPLPASERSAELSSTSAAMLAQASSPPRHSRPPRAPGSGLRAGRADEHAAPSVRARRSAARPRRHDRRVSSLSATRTFSLLLRHSAA